MALTRHPDRVANLELEVREHSEQKRKEINIAYAEFKGQGGRILGGAKPA